MKEAIQTLLTSDKMAHAFEYLKQDEAHTIDQQIELVQISSFSPFCLFVYDCYCKAPLHPISIIFAS